ncbi:hypothetical protein DM01DRAFT_1018887 [Hesseltinella vesiculosa]|uniref:Uncharacterized protein n=1 Tax=Hesseltinella vesiculosa TaxID=101127 RepID=A0A1X2GKV7_9FUNG|nr:hypothetical protein DM01DRAFT_1018887 [Hesseltinella vesiculosa]
MDLLAVKRQGVCVTGKGGKRALFLNIFTVFSHFTFYPSHPFFLVSTWTPRSNGSVDGQVEAIGIISDDDAWRRIDVLHQRAVYCDIIKGSRLEGIIGLRFGSRSSIE